MPLAGQASWLARVSSFAGATWPNWSSELRGSEVWFAPPRRRLPPRSRHRAQIAPSPSPGAASVEPARHGRSRAQSSARWAVRLRSGSARSARTWDGAERDVDDPAFHGHVCTAVVPLENLREGRRQGAQLLVLLGLDGLDLGGVAEAFEQLAELGLALLRDLLPGREFLRLGRSHQLFGLRVADLQRTILHSCWLRPAVAAGLRRHDRRSQ